MNAPPTSDKERRTVVFVLVALALLALFVPPHGVVHRDVYTWSWYHYYLGSKYFDELGYLTIYEQTIASEREVGGDLAGLTRTRDLRTYQKRRISKMPPERFVRSESWTDARWQEFQADFESLRPGLNREQWRRLMTDRGYNATPPWNTAARWVTNRLSVQNHGHRSILKAVDVVALFAVLLVFLRVFGARRTGLFLAAFLAFPTTANRFLGTPVQYDWFVVICLVMAAAAARRRGWLGFLIGVAVAMRVFPAVFVGGAAAWTAFQIYDHRRIPPGTARFVGGLALALALAGAVGSVGPAGVGTWSDFGDNIELHRQHHKYDGARVGLTHIFTGTGISHQAPKRGDRRGNVERRTLQRQAVAGTLVLLLVLALRRRDEADATLLMMVAFFVLTVSSRYYWTVLSLFVLFGAGAGAARGRFSMRLGLILAFVPSLLYVGHLAIHFHPWARWVFFNQVLTVFFIVALAALVKRDIQRSGGLRVWLRPGPEPEPPRLPPPESLTAGSGQGDAAPEPAH